MQKKMAMIMTGVTVATSVAPIFADNTAQNINVRIDSKNEAAVKELAQNLRTISELKYEKNNFGKDYVYEIKVNNQVFVNSSELETAISKLAKGQKLTVTVKDNGHQMLDGVAVDYTIEEYASVKEILDALKNKGLYVTNSTDSVTVKEVATSTTEVVIKPGDEKLDFSKKIKDTKNQLIGFEKELTKINVAETMVITVENVNEIDVNELFDGVRLTSKGMELVESLHKNAILTMPELPGFNAEADGATRLKIDMGTKGTMTVVGDFGTIREFKAVLENRENMTISSLAGKDRFETAIEVSKASFEGGKADAVVLVGQNAIVDGLASAPLAAEKNAPILLAQKDGLTKEIEDEMLRVLGTENLEKKTIYIVGGDSQISKEAEAKLAKLGTEVVRLSGDDRYQTSLAIAEEVTSKQTTTDKTTFVVGGEGEVDAMSIASYAAKVKAPIVVVNKDAVSEEAKEFMTENEIVVVGGKSSVSEEVLAELDALDGKKNTVERLAGDDRQGTNAAVINEYYKDATVAFVAKDGYVGGKSQLIDALTAAPLAGSQGAPIVLSTNSVSVEQKEAVQSNLKSVKKIFQIGQGIADSVIVKIAEIIKGN